jgi:hypothetical protein
VVAAERKTNGGSENVVEGGDRGEGVEGTVVELAKRECDVFGRKVLLGNGDSGPRSGGGGNHREVGAFGERGSRVWVPGLAEKEVDNAIDAKCEEKS